MELEDHNSPRCQHGPVDVGHRLCAGLYVIIVVQDILLIIQELLVGSSVKARLSLFTNINPLLLLPPGQRWAFMLHWFSKYETYLPEVVEVGHHVVVERLAGQHRLCLRHHLLEEMDEDKPEPEKMQPGGQKQGQRKWGWERLVHPPSWWQRVCGEESVKRATWAWLLIAWLPAGMHGAEEKHLGQGRKQNP